MLLPTPSRRGSLSGGSKRPRDMSSDTTARAPTSLAADSASPPRKQLHVTTPLCPFTAMGLVHDCKWVPGQDSLAEHLNLVFASASFADAGALSKAHVLASVQSSHHVLFCGCKSFIDCGPLCNPDPALLAHRRVCQFAAEAAAKFCLDADGIVDQLSALNAIRPGLLLKELGSFTTPIDWLECDLELRDYGQYAVDEAGQTHYNMCYWLCSFSRDEQYTCKKPSLAHQLRACAAKAQLAPLANKLAVPLCLNEDYLVRGQPADAPCMLASACEVSPSLVFDSRVMKVFLYKGAGSGPIRLYVRERNHFLEVILRGPSQRLQQAHN